MSKSQISKEEVANLYNKMADLSEDQLADIANNLGSSSLGIENGASLIGASVSVLNLFKKKDVSNNVNVCEEACLDVVRNNNDIKAFFKNHQKATESTIEIVFEIATKVLETYLKSSFPIAMVVAVIILLIKKGALSSIS